MAELNHYGAGLEDGKVRIADGTLFDIDAVVSAEGDPQVDDVEVKGDDEVKAKFFFNQRENMTISANALSFDVIQAITGNSYASSAGGLDVALGTESEQNPPIIEIQASTKGKDSAGVAVTIRKTWHKVQVGTIKVSQSGENEFNLEMTGLAFPTDEDVTGASLTPKRVATLAVEYA